MVSLALIILLAGSFVYLFLSIVAAFRYLRGCPPALGSMEPISILKPLAGLDEELESNLRTFFEQDYPVFEILFAVREENDPAVGVVQKLQRQFPRVPSRLLITGESPYPNAKVFSLSQMLALAANDLVVTSDSDIRADRGLLRDVAAEFQNPDLGVATCPYRTVPGNSIWSRLEATGLNTDFLAGILVARMLDGMRFAVGATIAVRRTALKAIGGFDRLKDYLADDFVIGKFAAEAHFGVILSPHVVEHRIGSTSFYQNASHRLRWLRSTRRSRPAGYFGQLFTMPFPLALLVCFANRAWWPVLPLTLLVRGFAGYIMSVRILKTKIHWMLLLLEDVVGFCFWLAGFFGNKIVWRERQYRLKPDGRFEFVGTLNKG